MLIDRISTFPQWKTSDITPSLEFLVADRTPCVDSRIAITVTVRSTLSPLTCTPLRTL